MNKLDIPHNLAHNCSMSSIAEKFEELCHRAGHDVAHDGNNLIIKDHNTGALLAIPKNSGKTLNDMVHNASKHGVLVNHVWDRGGDIHIGHTTIDVPLMAAGEYTIKPTSPKQTWFDVIDADGNIVNEKRLRKDDAVALVESLG